MVSIIIVNYNVKYFLEQCLHSVLRATAGILAEVIVVDNNSSDGSVDYLRPRFPALHFIANRENMGFGRACNLGWRQAKGDFILFLNPDTILSEDAISQALQVFGEQATVGAVGIRMIDGSGKFLRESKRGFPNPAASFYKLTGLAGLFPHTRPFSDYYLGHLPDDRSQEVDVLAGAFMMIRRRVLTETGGFDEQFFMYGEDIDLSFRIQEAGFKNWYIADSTILHFKGESTNKDITYFRRFYSAMILFVKKHYRHRPGWFLLLLQLCINVSGIFSFFTHRRNKPQAGGPVRAMIAGTEEEAEGVMRILEGENSQLLVAGNARSPETLSAAVLEKAAGLVIFCNGSFDNKSILSWMQQQRAGCTFEFHFPGSSSIVGSSNARAQAVGGGTA